MRNSLFYSEDYKSIEKKVKDFLNKQSDFLSPRTISSPRAVGDAIQGLLTDHFKTILGGAAKEYSSEFARRSMADLAFTDRDNFYHVVDVKTHRIDTHFNMPNLTSVERLARFYEDDKNYFVILNVAYGLERTEVKVRKVHFVPIEFLSWSCLTLGALGWGQIQIANSNVIDVVRQSRKKWMIKLCDTLFDFYPAEMGKIKERIKYFKRVKERWLARRDL